MNRFTPLESVILDPRTFNLSNLIVGFGCDSRSPHIFSHGDINLFALLIGEDKNILNPDGLIFYNKKSTRRGAVVLDDDCVQDGDDEFLKFDLNRIGVDVKEITIACVIYSLSLCQNASGNFSQVKNLYIRISDSIEWKFLEKFEIDTRDVFASAISVIEISKVNDKWTISPAFKMFSGGFDEIARTYGLQP